MIWGAGEGVCLRGGRWMGGGGGCLSSFLVWDLFLFYFLVY